MINFRSFRGNAKGVNSNIKAQNRGVIKNNRGRMRTNVSVRGRGGKMVTDARMKIIEKNRLKMTDARDRLADIAKQSDARLKLDKLRATQLKKEIPALGISRKTGKNGRITLSTNKNVVPHGKGMRQSYPPQLGISYEPPVIPMETGYNDLGKQHFSYFNYYFNHIESYINMFGNNNFRFRLQITWTHKF